MKIQLSLQNRIFIVLVTIAILTLVVIWFLIRPKYEKSVITERLTNVQQLQIYAIENLDRTILSWLNVTKLIASQLSEKPKDGESIIRTMMMLHPEIIQIKVNSPKSTDELISQNTAYPQIKLDVSDTNWILSKIDTSLQIAWLDKKTFTQDVFAIKTNFQVQNIPFKITIIWDAKSLSDINRNIPLGENYFFSIQSASHTITQNESTFRPIQVGGIEHTSTMQTLKQGEQDWRIIISAFKTIQLWMVIAIPEKTILKPVTNLLIYTSSFIIGLLSVLSILGWILSHQISKPINRLVNDVKKLSSLDFSKPISIPEMKDLRGMGETIELMRQVLEKYQRMNVDKIILEEWKNKLLMTHSDDMIGITDNTGLFLFQNDKLEEFCSSLIATRQIRTKHDLLSHPSITIIKEIVRDETSENLWTHLIQYEIKVQTKSDSTNYFRVNDLSIVKNEENLGSLIIYHDLTNERLIDKMKTDMINIVVHELRNPVASIMGFSELLLSDPSITEAEEKEFLNLILTSSKNLNNLINRFLDISRLESRRIEYPKSLTNVIEIVKSVIETFKPQLINKKLETELNITGEIPQIVVSQQLFREAISNLLSNAIKYGQENRTIHMYLSIENKDFIFSIIDHGYGISPEAQEKLFTKFYRVPNSKTASEAGTGLGLAYVKEIVNYHGGNIYLESNAELGCKFTIRLPMVSQ